MRFQRLAGGVGDALRLEPHRGKPWAARAFAAEAVTLFAIVRQRKRHFTAVKKELQEAGVEPVFNSKKIGATFYRRKDVEGEIGSSRIGT